MHAIYAIYVYHVSAIKKYSISARPYTLYFCKQKRTRKKERQPGPIP